MCAVFGSTAFARSWQRWYISLGKLLRGTSAEVSATDKISVQTWMRSLSSSVWPFPISREDRMSNGKNQGRLKCKRRLVLTIRGITQIARLLFDLENPVSVCVSRACHGADEARSPHYARDSVEPIVRRLVRGSPLRDVSMDFWPGVKAGNRAPVVRSVCKPQAEPSDVPQGRPAFPYSEFAPRAKRRVPAGVLTPPPQRVRDKIKGCPSGASSSVAEFPLRAMGPPRDTVDLMGKEIEVAPW